MTAQGRSGWYRCISPHPACLVHLLDDQHPVVDLLVEDGVPEGHVPHCQEVQGGSSGTITVKLNQEKL